MIVIHYIPSIDRASGGTTAYMQLLSKELGRLVELHVVSHESANPVQMDNCQVHFVPSLRRPLAMKRGWQGLLRQLKPAVVHINGCWTPGCAMAQRWAQSMGFKVVLTPHGMLEPWIMARHYYTRKLPAWLLYQKAAVRKADLLHATADSEKNNLFKLGCNDRIDVIANGIDVDAIEMKLSWQRTGQALFLSRVHPKKGIDLLIEAMAKIPNKCGYVINIAGEGDDAYIGELKMLAQRRGVAGNIKFVGGVYGERKWELFRQADVFILPTHSENFGIVVAEALASGTPVITTKGTPWAELETKGCGWWVDIDINAIACAFSKFLKLDETQLQKMGHNGRALVECEYSSATVARMFVDMYERCKAK